MNMTRDRVQSIVWTMVVVVSAALLVALTFRVNAVKSRVRLTERRIVALQQEKQGLDTEFQTRANQQQLAAINAVEFGLKAPTAAQYVDGERQLAALSAPIAPAFTPGVAAAPVRMAIADVPSNGAANVTLGVSPNHTVNVPAKAAASERAGSPDHAGFAVQLARTDRPKSVIQATPTIRVASATGSLPRVLGPLANRKSAVGGGTRLLSDRDEVRGKPAKHGSSAQAVPGAARLATRDETPRKSLPAHLAVRNTASKKSVPAQLAIQDAAPKSQVVARRATKNAALRKPVTRQLAQAKPATESGPANLLPTKWAAVKQPHASAATRHSTPEKLALGDDARADPRASKR